MAQQITQQLGFDATQAIQSIAQLNSALASLTQQMAALGQAARLVNGLNLSQQLGKIAGGAKAAAAQFQKLSQATSGVNGAANAVNNAKRATDRWAISLQTLGRIFQAQVIVRAIGSIQAKMSEAIDTTEKFQTALAETAAISPRLNDTASNFGQIVGDLGKEVKGLSAQFGFDVIDIAEAKYQELSNSVKGTAQSNELLVESLKLARVTNTDVGTSLEAISSILNSYGQTVADSDRASAALFETVRIGRLRLKDVADQLGNVTPLARDVGISFNEVGAALATITRTGVSPERALTEIRAVINQLQKPTKELQKLFDRFGVANVEQAIQKFGGLGPLIKAIAQASEEGNVSLGKLFTNIRSRTGITRIAQDFEFFTKTLNEINTASEEGAGFIDRLLKGFDDTDVIKFKKAVNDLNLAFIELAQAGLPTLTSALQSITVAVQNVGTVFSFVAGGALVYYGVQATQAAAATRVLGVSLATLGPIIAGFGIGIILGQVIKMADEARVAGNTLERLGKIDVAGQSRIDQFTTDLVKARKEIDGLGKEFQKLIDPIRQAETQVFKSLSDSNSVFVAGVKGSLSTLVGVREDFVKGLEDAIAKAEENVTKSQQDQTKIREELADREFTNRIRGLTDAQKAFANLRQADEAISKARLQPRTDKGLEEQLRLLERAKKFAEEASKLGESTGNRTLLTKAEQAIADILNEQLRTKQAQATLDQQQADKAKQKLQAEQANLDLLKDAVKRFEGGISLFGGTQPLGTEARQQALSDAKEALDDIKRLAFTGTQFDLAQFLGLQDLASRFNDQLQKLDVQFNVDRPKLQAQIDSATRDLVAQVPIEFFAKTAERLNLGTQVDAVKPVESLSNLYSEVVEKIKQAQDQEKAFNVAQEEVTIGAAKVRDFLTQIRDAQTSLAKAPIGASIAQLQNNLQTLESVFLGLVEKTRTNKLITDEDITNARRLLDAFNQIGVGDVPGTPLGGEQQFISDFVTQLEALRTAQQNLFGARANFSAGQLQELQSLESALRGQLSVQQQTVSAQKDLTRAINESAAAQQRLQELMNRSSGGQSRMFGGTMQYLARGGFARGTDTIPAMLSPGEFVMNAKASRRFASQLIAMNAGVAPVYRAEGGVVNNSINIGDVKVNGTADPDVTARLVVSQLRREFRRGTSSF